MNPSLFERLDALAPRVTPTEYGVMLEMALQCYSDPGEFESMLGGQLEIVERRIIDDLLHGRSIQRTPS